MFFASNAPNETFKDKLDYILANKDALGKFLNSIKKIKKLDAIGEFISNSKLSIKETATFLFTSKISFEDEDKYWHIMSKCQFCDYDKLTGVSSSLLKGQLKDIEKIKLYNYPANDLIPQFAHFLSNNPIEDSEEVLNLLMGTCDILKQRKINVDTTLKVDVALRQANLNRKPLIWMKTFFEYIRDAEFLEGHNIYLEINLKLFQHYSSINTTPTDILSQTRLSSPPSSPKILRPDDYDSSDDDINFLLIEWGEPKNELEEPEIEREDSKNSKRKRSEDPDPIKEAGPSSSLNPTFAKVLACSKGRVPQI